jgi:hypothetical protein
MRHACGIDRHALQPALESVDIPKSTDLAPRGDECLLGGIGRIGFVAEDRERQSMHSVHPGTHDLLERIEVAFAGSFDERAVDRGRDGSSCGVRSIDAGRRRLVHGTDAPPKTNDSVPFDALLDGRRLVLDGRRIDQKSLRLTATK